MRFSRTVTRLLAVAVSASAALTSTVAEPASAASTTTAMTVAVNAPEFAAGIVEVTITIVADATLKPTQAVVQLGDDATTSWKPLIQTLPIAAGTCDVTCTLTTSFDTLAWTRPEPWLPDPNVYDRQKTVRATVSDGVTSGAAGYTIVYLGNRRPQIQGTSGSSIGLVRTDQILRASIATLDSFGTDPVTRALWWVPGHTDSVPPVDVTATDSPGRWHLATSLAALPSGSYLLRVVAFNAAGAASEPFDQWFTVDHGPVVSVDFPAAATILPTDATLAAAPTITVTAAADPSVWLTGVTVLLDGTTIVGGFTGASHFEPFYRVWLNAAPLPAGSHTLTFLATDTRGLNTSVRFAVKIDSGAVLHTSISGDLVHGGTRPTLTTSFQAYPGTTLASWAMEIDANPAGSGVFCSTGGCPAQANTVRAWPAGEMFNSLGTHTVTVRVTDSVGVSTSRVLIVRSRLATSRLSDFNRDGSTDLVARDPAGALWLYPGNGAGGIRARHLLGRGWNIMTALVTPGDITGDGNADVLGRDTTGRLWLYPGNGSSGFQARRQIGSGWNVMNAISGAGDLNRAGRPDLLARDSAGNLWLYPLSGSAVFGARIRIGTGWNGYTFRGPGDSSGDGRADILARDTTGNLWLYKGNGAGGVSARTLVGTRWAGMSALVSPGDWDGTGGNDILARDGAGTLWQYPGNNTGGLGARRSIGTGWNGYTIN